MTDEPATQPIEQLLQHGEKFSPQWSYRFIDCRTIEKGEFIVPAQVSATTKSGEYAALNMILKDLTFALDCFVEADKIGIPDASNIQGKALVFSAVVSYARPFKTGVREIKLHRSFFSGLQPAFNDDLHNFLIAVRDKHVAHSVNEFERCEPIAVMVGTPETKWRAAGFGIVEQHAIGLNRQIVQQAIAQIQAMREFLGPMIQTLTDELFNEFKVRFDRDGKWQQAPIMHALDRAKVSRPRS